MMKEYKCKNCEKIFEDEGLKTNDDLFIFCPTCITAYFKGDENKNSNRFEEIRNTSKIVAEEKGLIVVEWSNLTKKQQEPILNLTDFHVTTDIPYMLYVLDQMKKIYKKLL
jgi:acetyl-CoA carboxylase beta subunit